MPLVYTPDLLFEGFSLSRAVLLDSVGNEIPDGVLYGARSVNWDPEIESFDEFSHDKLINVWSDVRRVNFTLEAGFTSLAAWAKVTGSSVESEPLITNLLGANQASGTDTLGDVTGFGTGGGSVTLTSSTAWAALGTRSLKCVISSSNYPTLALDGIPTRTASVIAGETYTVQTALNTGTLSGTSLADLNMYLNFYDAMDAHIGGTEVRSSMAGSEHRQTVVVPALSAYMLVRIGIYNGSANVGEYFYLDKMGLWKGAGGTWAMPGAPIEGLTGLPANYVDRLPLYEHGKSNGIAFPLRLTFPAKDAQGNTQDLSLTLFKVKFKPPKSSGASYKDGQSVTYEATALLSSTDEVGTVLEREAFGRIDRAYSVG